MEGSTKGISKTYWIEFTSCVHEGKNRVSSKKVTLVDM